MTPTTPAWRRPALLGTLAALALGTTAHAEDDQGSRLRRDCPSTSRNAPPATSPTRPRCCQRHHGKG